MAKWDAPDHGLELFVDQQVFVDAVRGNEQVEEFSALTEVTTLEQRGENLYLEGNMLFTAYLADDMPEQGDDHVNGEQAVEHLQHRMPFDISLPAAAQGPGLLSVSVHVPDATMDILGPGWIHLRAVLEFEGLQESGGYTAHCGAQEAIVPPKIVESFVVSDPGEATAVQEQVASEEDNVIEAQEIPVIEQAEVSEAFLAQEAVEVQENSPTKEESVLGEWALLAARSEQSAKEGEASEPSASSITTWQKDLLGADRALQGPQVFTLSPFRSGVAPENVQESTQLMRQEEFFERDLSDDLHFHFEHVNLPEEERKWTTGLGDSTMLHAEFSSSSHDNPKTLELEAKSESKRLLQAIVAPIEPDVPFLDSESQVQATYKVTEEEETTLTTAEWFWKSLNIPSGETNFMMKFRIVQPSETLEDIAQLYRINLDDLLRANPLTQEGLPMGSLLYIPVRS